jgi:RNA polymerase sigma factor (sigma-70 family)
MTTTPTTATVLSHIRHWLSRARAETSSDADLLRRFIQDGDESAFALLMDRHGAMVLGTARRLLGDEHLAEDVFQATFLTLARQAGRLRRAAALPAWLHAIACRLALTALRGRKRRQRAEGQAVPRPADCPCEAASSQEQLAILDEELRRLPERFRLPLVLCCLEGRSQAEAAVLLGWTPGSVKGRLERGRRHLHDRLLRRGLTVAAAAAMPTLVRPTLAAALREAALRAARQGAIESPLVSALVHEACKPFVLASWKTILIVAILGLVGTGVGVASRFGRPEQAARPADPPPPAEEKRPSPRAELDPDALPQGALARLGWSPLRIGYANFALAPDGRTIIVVTPQGNLRRLDAKTGRLLERRQLTDRRDVGPGDGTGIHLPVLSAKGETVAISESSYVGPRVTVYDVASGKQIFRRASTETTSTQLGGLSPDGKQLAVIESENKGARLRMCDIKTGRMKEMGSLQDSMASICFSGDGQRLIVIAQDLVQTNNSHVFNQPAPHILTAFDLSSGKELWRRTVVGMSFAISHDDKMVLASGRPKQDNWNVWPGVLPDSNICATGFHVLEMDSEAKKWTERFVPCQLNAVFLSHLNLASFMLAPDNRTVVINHFDGRGAAYIVSWDLRTRKENRRFKLPESKGGQLIPLSMALSADGRTLFTAGDYLQRWDLRNGKPFFTPPLDEGLPGSLLQIAFTPDGKEVLASSISNLSGRWNAATGKRIDLIHDHYSGHPFIRTPDGLRTVREEARPGGWFELTVLDPVAHKTLHTVRNTSPNEGFGYATLTANGKTLLAIKPSKNSSQVTAWDVANGHKRSHFILSGASAFPRSPFSPCGRWVVLNGKLYHAGSGTALFAPAGAAEERLIFGKQKTHGPVWFSEDGRLMAAHLRKAEAKSAAEDALAVWELASGQILARFPKAGFVAQVAFAPHGRTIALLDAQGVRVEDLLSGKRLATYPAPDVIHGSASDEQQGIVFAPDGSTLATGHQDGSIVLWKMPPSRNAHSAALADGDIAKLWADLGSSSPATARAAVDRMACHPDAAAVLLATRFRPPPADDKLVKLIKDLDSDDFATREEASRKLRAVGAKAEAVLRRTLAQAPSLELRRRIEGILAEMTPLPLHLPLSGERLRGVRAIEVLERIGNAAARKMLLSWAEQTEEVHLAIEARMALERLGPLDAKWRSPENKQSP